SSHRRESSWIGEGVKVQMRNNNPTLKLISEISLVLLALYPPLSARVKKHAGESLDSYIQRNSQPVPEMKPASPGSLWIDNGRLVGIASDYKATRVGDVISIVVAQDVTAQSAGNVTTARTYNATSGITALPGQLKTTGLANLFSPNSSEN